MGDQSICNDINYKNMILQKQRFQLMNIPPVRYDNLANNPYNLIYPGTSKKFTKMELDMRRKVEVLKYNANNSSTQTNRFTKAEIYAQAVSGKYQQRTYSNLFIKYNSKNNKLNTCPTIKTPSSSCDVPGNVIFLYEDDNVPLYNYTTNIDANYGILTQGDNPYGKTWDYTEENNKTSVKNYTSFTSIITSLFIYYNVVSYETFTIVTPITLTFQGTKSSLINPSMKFQITSVATNILYNNTVYKKIQSSDHLFPTSLITVTPTGIINSSYSGNCYLGTITIKNIEVPIQKGYIFDIQTVVYYTNEVNNVIVNTLDFTFNVSSFTRSIIDCSITGDVYPIASIPLMTVTTSV